MSTLEIIEELQALKARVRQLEMQLESKDREIRALKGEQEAIHDHGERGVKGLADRVRQIEDTVNKEALLGKWAERITLSGLVEVEAGYESVDFDDPAAGDDHMSDIVLATVELGVDVDIAKHLKGHVLFLWEEDETEPVDLDEGFIILDGEDSLPLYLHAGKMYVPFGYFESHFISDPLTLELGETNETAVKVGYVCEWLEVSGSLYNGDIDESGAGNHVEGFVLAAMLSLPEGTLPDLSLTAGASYISNIGDSDTLQDEDGIDFAVIRDRIPGFAAFLSLSCRERVFLELEYLGALDEFQPGELAFDGGEGFKPKAWNLELAFVPVEDLEVALKYEGGDDLGDLLPESQFGVAVIYSLFENTSLALEYLRGEFENGDVRDLITSQLAIEF
jgi:hypothetical protein